MLWACPHYSIPQTMLETATKGSIMSGKWMVRSQFQLKEKDKWKHFPGTMRGLVPQEASQSISICGGQRPCVVERRRTWPCRWPLSITGRKAPNLNGLIHGQAALASRRQGETMAGLSPLGWSRISSTFLTSECAAAQPKVCPFCRQAEEESLV